MPMFIYYAYVYILCLCVPICHIIIYSFDFCDIYALPRTSYKMAHAFSSFGPSLFSTVTVVLDVYTHNTTLTFGDSVPFGTQIIIICQVVGLPYGTPLNYTWACSNGPCEVEGYYGRKIYNEHILAVNTTTTSDGGTYTCQVTAAGGQEATGSFTLGVTGMSCTTAVSYV